MFVHLFDLVLNGPLFAEHMQSARLVRLSFGQILPKIDAGFQSIDG